MTGNSLSKIEVVKRLVRLRNLERLYETQRLRLRTVIAENTTLKARMLVLEERDRATDKVIDDLKLQIAELRKGLRVLGMLR